MDVVTESEHRRAAARVREWLATYEQKRDFILLGAYKPGSDAHLDQAIAKIEAVTAFLRQGLHEAAEPDETRRRLLALC
jgi:flagellar biosynthesis/type III secretory pathway ATPase